MFHAVRQWWGSGRGKVTARLFLFEFIVVMVGVLAAQALQNWAAHRGAMDQMEETRARTKRELADNLAYALTWKAAIPCLDRRMQDVMRALSTGPLDPEIIERPSLATFISSAVDDQSELLWRERYGNRSADLVKAMQLNIAHAGNDIGTIVHSWGRLSLADPRLGPVSALDRGEARTAAADIRAELRGLNFAVDEFVGRARASNIAAHSPDRIRPARNCEEIWSRGMIAIPF